MKKLLVLLFSIFFLSSSSVFADDISDFEIEGMSIGDSLLDYMTEEEILEEIEKTKDLYLHLNEPNKYAEVYIPKKLKAYDSLLVLIKNNSTSQYVTNKNEKYTLLGLRGAITYNEDFDNCIVKRNEIADELSKVFLNLYKWSSVESHPADPSGKSIVDGIYFEFDSGSLAKIYCSNWEETLRIKNKWLEGLRVTIDSKEITEWLGDY